jgi:hypothetical protein
MLCITSSPRQPLRPTSIKEVLIIKPGIREPQERILHLIRIKCIRDTHHFKDIVTKHLKRVKK